MAHMKHSHVRQRLMFLEQLAHMTHGHMRLVFLKLVMLERIPYVWRVCYQRGLPRLVFRHKKKLPKEILNVPFKCKPS